MSIKYFSSIFAVILAILTFQENAFAMNYKTSKATRNILNKNYHVFNDEDTLFSKPDIQELDQLIELIGTREKYNNNDGFETHQNTHYGNAAFFVYNTGTIEQPNFGGRFVKEGETWVDFEEGFYASYLEEDILDTPIIPVLIRKVMSVLRSPPAQAGFIIKIKFVCSHEDSHVGLRKHQDNVHYLFTLVTNAKDIDGGQMGLYRLAENSRSALHEGKYCYGADAELISEKDPCAGAGYFIKERPDYSREESQFRPIVHGHSAWKKNGPNPTRNIVIVRITYLSAEPGDTTIVIGPKQYRFY